MKYVQPDGRVVEIPVRARAKHTSRGSSSVVVDIFFFFFRYGVPSIELKRTLC